MSLTLNQMNEPEHGQPYRTNNLTVIYATHLIALISSKIPEVVLKFYVPLNSNKAHAITNAYYQSTVANLVAILFAR